jgi:hypothetical protein
MQSHIWLYKTEESGAISSFQKQNLIYTKIDLPYLYPAEVSKGGTAHFSMVYLLNIPRYQGNLGLVRPKCGDRGTQPKYKPALEGKQQCAQYLFHRNQPKCRLDGSWAGRSKVEVAYPVRM